MMFSENSKVFSINKEERYSRVPRLSDTRKTRKNAIVEYLDYQIPETRKDAIVEYLDYQIPVSRKNAIVEYLDYQIPVIRKNAIVEYLDYQIPVTLSGERYSRVPRLLDTRYSAITDQGEYLDYQIPVTQLKRPKGSSTSTIRYPLLS